METILVVEDHVSVQKVLRRLFESAGYESRFTVTADRRWMPFKENSDSRHS